jgi:hypothetical protein
MPAPGAEAVLSLLIGLIVLLMQRNLTQQLAHWLLGAAAPAPFKDGAGRQFAYTQTDFFIHDLGLGIFALALILEGLALFSRRIMLLVPGFVLMVIAALWNLYIVTVSYGTYGLQIMPALAMAFAIYIAMMQWGMLSRRLLPRA